MKYGWPECIRVIRLSDNVVVAGSGHKNCRAWGDPNEDEHRIYDGTIITSQIHYSKIEEPGLYHVCATGAWYSYFDGKQWYAEYDRRNVYKFEFEKVDGYNDKGHRI